MKGQVIRTDNLGDTSGQVFGIENLGRRAGVPNGTRQPAPRC